MKQKGFAQALMLIIAVVGLVAGLYLVGKATNILPQAKETDHPAPVSQAVQNIDNRMPPINNKQDLENRLQDLENTNVDSLDQQVSDNESDAVGF
jgi:hypothetical protein